MPRRTDTPRPESLTLELSRQRQRRAHRGGPGAQVLRVAAVLLCTLGAATAHAAQATLAPSAVATARGTTGAQPLEVLATAELAGSTTDPTASQRYTPGNRGYQCVFTFRLGSRAKLARSARATLRTSFYGQPASAQRWTFEVRDWVAKRWIPVGQNDTGAAHRWTPLSFPVGVDPTRLVNGQGELKVRYSTATPLDSSDLDLLVLDLPLAGGAPAPGSDPSASDGTTSGLRSVFAGSFSSTPDQIDYVANVADLQITSSGPSKVAQIHAANPGSRNVYRYSKIAGAAPSDPHWDEVVAADLLWPGPSGNPVTQTQFGWYWLDIGTPEKQAAWVAILVETLNEYLADGYDGIYFDNVGIIDPSLINEFPADYTDAGYYADVGDVLAGLRAALPGVKLIINSYTGGQPAGLRGLEYLPYTDGMSFEAFSMKASTRFMDAGRWFQQLSDFAYVVAQGKLTIALDYTQTGDMQRRMWSLASYLLVNSPRSYHRVAGTNVQADLQEYPEDQLDLGTALGEASIRIGGLTERSYSGGKVLANPHASTLEYDLNGGAWEELVLIGGGTYPSPGSLAWQPIAGAKLAIPPNSAAIIRSTVQGPPRTVPPPSDASGLRSVFAGSFSSTPDQIDYVANVADLQITSSGPSKVAQIHAANPGSRNVYRYSKIAGAAPSDPHWDEVVAADLLWPGPSGNPVTQTQFGWYWLDIGTPEKRAAWVAILVETLNEYLADGYDGIYFDNVGIIDPSLINEFPADYTDAGYYADVGDVLAGLRAALPGVELIINSYTGGQPAGLRGLEYLPYTDGMSFEAFSMKASTRFMDAGRWFQQLSDFAYVVAQGKLTIAMDYTQTGDMQRRMWSLASYLLVNSPRSYHRVAGTNVQADLQEYPEDQLDLGTALGPPLARFDGLTEGLYTGGKIVANPNITAKSYELGTGSWEQLVLVGGGTYPSPGSITWQAIAGTTLELPANSAAIVRPR